MESDSRGMADEERLVPKGQILTEKTFAEQLGAAIEQARQMDAPLNMRLKIVADKVRELSPSFADVVDRMVARLADNGIGIAAPQPGEQMPAFLLPDDSGRLLKLASLLTQGPVAISINRGHWCPYCRLNIDALARASAEIQELGASVVVISPETLEWISKLKADTRGPFHFLSDLDGGYALELGLLFWVGDDMQRMMAGGGVDLVQFQGNATWMLPVPATFVVGTDGIVTARYVDPDFRQRMDIDDLLANLKEAAADHANQAR